MTKVTVRLPVAIRKQRLNFNGEEERLNDRHETRGGGTKEDSQ